MCNFNFAQFLNENIQSAPSIISVNKGIAILYPAFSGTMIIMKSPVFSR